MEVFNQANLWQNLTKSDTSSIGRISNYVKISNPIRHNEIMNPPKPAPENLKKPASNIPQNLSTEKVSMYKSAMQTVQKREEAKKLCESAVKDLASGPQRITNAKKTIAKAIEMLKNIEANS